MTPKLFEPPKEIIDFWKRKYEEDMKNNEKDSGNCTCS
jgi:hypothetical protein